MKDIWVMMYTVPTDEPGTHPGSQEIYTSHWMRLLSAFICNWNWQQLSWSNGSQKKKNGCAPERKPDRDTTHMSWWNEPPDDKRHRLKPGQATNIGTFKNNPQTREQVGRDHVTFTVFPPKFSPCFFAALVLNFLKVRLTYAVRPPLSLWSCVFWRHSSSVHPAISRPEIQIISL